MKSFYVYQLIDPRNGLVFYVGKGTGNRVKHHVMHSRSLRGNQVKNAKIREIIDAGFEVVERIAFEGLTENAAFALERQMIEDLRDDLTNISGGVVTAAQSLVMKVERFASSLKSFDEWSASASHDAREHAIRKCGSLRAFYDQFIQEVACDKQMAMADAS